MASVSLTRRAFRDLHDIERYSVERWGGLSRRIIWMTSSKG